MQRKITTIQQFVTSASSWRHLVYVQIQVHICVFCVSSFTCIRCLHLDQSTQYLVLRIGIEVPISLVLVTSDNKGLLLLHMRHDTPQGKAEETNFWSRYFCCFFAHKKYSLSFVKIHWSTDVTWIILTMSLLCSWALIVVGPLPSMQGQKALGFHQKYLNLCSDDERRSYGFGTTRGLAIN